MASARIINTQSCAPWGFRRVVIDTEESVGSILHQARMSKKKSLIDCSLYLRIPERYIRAIEEENLSVLPGLVYEKHFIHRYASALGLEPAPLINSWSALRKDSVVPTSQFVARVRWGDLWISPFFWRRTLAGLAVVIVGLYLGGRLLVMVRPPSLTIISPEESMTTIQRTIVVSGVTEQETKVTVNGETVLLKDDGSFEVPLTLQSGVNTVQVAAAKRYSRAAIVERRVFVAVSSPVSEGAGEGGVVLRTSSR